MIVSAITGETGALKQAEYRQAWAKGATTLEEYNSSDSLPELVPGVWLPLSVQMRYIATAANVLQRRRTR